MREVSGTCFRGRTKKTPPPADSVTTARNFGLTAQKLLSCAFFVIFIPS